MFINPPGHEDPKVNAVILLLQEAWNAWEQGIIWEPELDYTFQVKPHWDTQKGRERIIGKLDARFLKELSENGVHWDTDYGLTKHPEFFRFSDGHRLALLQRMDAVLAAFPERLPPLGQVQVARGIAHG